MHKINKSESQVMAINIMILLKTLTLVFLIDTSKLQRMKEEARTQLL